MDSKKDNFKRISETRINKILTLINKLENLSNSSFYSYTDEEIILLFAQVEKALANQKELLLKKNTETKSVKL